MLIEREFPFSECYSSCFTAGSLMGTFWVLGAATIRSDMTISTHETYSAATDQAYEATEKAAAALRRNATLMADQVSINAWFRVIDATEPITRYFDFIQKTVDLNRELAAQWTGLVESLIGAVREQAEQLNGLVKDQVDTVADRSISRAQDAQRAAKERAEATKQVEWEQVEREQARLADQAERERAEQVREQTREPYEGLSEAELAQILTDRNLPESGTVEELIERLVTADTA